MPILPSVRSIGRNIQNKHMDRDLGQQELYCISTQINQLKLHWLRTLFTVLVRCPVHTPVCTPMYRLSFSQYNRTFFPVFQSVYNNIYIITHLASHMYKWPSRRWNISEPQIYLQLATIKSLLPYYFACFIEIWVWT